MGGFDPIPVIHTWFETDETGPASVSTGGSYPFAAALGLDWFWIDRQCNLGFPNLVDRLRCVSSAQLNSPVGGRCCKSADQLPYAIGVRPKR